MRKRNIKSIAHWVIMSVLLLFPVLMVGVSAFANDEQTTTVNTTYEYETNELNSVNDIVVGNIYHLNFYSPTDDEYISTYLEGEIYFSYIFNLKFNGVANTTIDDMYQDTLPSSARLSSSGFVFNSLIYYDANDNQSPYFVASYLLSSSDFSSIKGFDFVLSQGDLESFQDYLNMGDTFGLYVGASDYLGEATTTVDIQDSNYKQEVNNWANGFKNLPVNQWYGNLLDVIGVGVTTNSVMNVIYVYPLYVLWVYILDLIVDCLLLIINFGHNALQRLGADNE